MSPLPKYRLVSVYVLLACNCVSICFPASPDIQRNRTGPSRWTDLKHPSQGQPGFDSVASAQTGIRFTNTVTEHQFAASNVVADGSGVALGDFDNDGRIDIFLAGMNTPSALYRNLGNWKFEEATGDANLPRDGKNYRGAVFVDLNGDHWLDLLVTTLGRGVLCFLNDGTGTFVDATKESGLSSEYGSMTLAIADVDGNGTLDVYVSNNRVEDIRDRAEINLPVVNGKIEVPPALQNRFVSVDGAILEYGEPDQLYLNDGRAHFMPVPWDKGAFLNEGGRPLDGPPLDWGLTATFRDMNDDGAPDLYVCNDFWTPDRIWLNDGKGVFRAMAKSALRNISANSMGVDFADIDRDGKVDAFVLDMLSSDQHMLKRRMLSAPPAALARRSIDDRPQFVRNTLFHNRGDGTFEEISSFAGVAATDWSWQPVFIDVDLDGYEDLLITSGHIIDIQDLDANPQGNRRQEARPARGGNPIQKQQLFTLRRMLENRKYPKLALPISALKNNGDLTFRDMTENWGTRQLGVHHGIALGDLDGDGDLDFVVNNLNGEAGVYSNRSAAPRVAVRLRGLPPNTLGVGARVKLSGGAVSMQSDEVVSGGHYLSGSDAMLVFAAGPHSDAMRLEVTWRNRKQSIVADVRADRLYEIDEESAQTAPPFAPRQAHPLFSDVSALLSHEHSDQVFDDFARQRLLPRKLSQGGPGIAWFDFDEDGWDDLLIGSGKGGKLAVFRNDAHGNFSRLTNSVLERIVARDQTALVGIGAGTLLLGSSGYEAAAPTGAGIQAVEPVRGAYADLIPPRDASVGPIAVADMDGDGDLELFFGGGIVGGKYPSAHRSRIYRRANGKWSEDGKNTQKLENVGLVNSALWSDLDGDGYPELVLACEWGPVRVFKNTQGTLEEATAALGLDRFTGWWNGVTTGDMDGDGRLDIIAANWGLNTPYEASAERPLKLLFADLSGANSYDLIETIFNEKSGTNETRYGLPLLAESIPALRQHFSTARSFGEAPLTQVVKALGQPLQEVQITTLSSIVFLNRDNHFEARSLPREAQMAPAFSVNVADFDGDGAEDIFLSQNFFSTRAEVPRFDAGRGLLLKGDGKGSLRALSAAESGIEAYGEQRGAAFADFDRDGKVDLAVTQNGAATKLFRNVGEQSGLRVKLKGPAAHVVGAGIQVVSSKGKGALREIHAGSGYWSQDSSTQVLRIPETPARIIIRWPGGKTTAGDIPASAREIEVDSAGIVTKVN